MAQTELTGRKSTDCTGSSISHSLNWRVETAQKGAVCASLFGKVHTAGHFNVHSSRKDTQVVPITSRTSSIPLRDVYSTELHKCTN